MGLFRLSLNWIGSSLFLSSVAQSYSWSENWRLCEPLMYENTFSGFVSEPIRHVADGLAQILCDHCKPSASLSYAHVCLGFFLDFFVNNCTVVFCRLTSSFSVMRPGGTQSSWEYWRPVRLTRPRWRSLYRLFVRTDLSAGPKRLKVRETNVMFLLLSVEQGFLFFICALVHSQLIGSPFREQKTACAITT